MYRGLHCILSACVSVICNKNSWDKIEMSAVGGGGKPHVFGVTLRRSSHNTPWGVRIVGGVDVGSSIVIIRVSRQFYTIFITLLIRPRNVIHDFVIFVSISIQSARHCFASRIIHIGCLKRLSRWYFVRCDLGRWQLYQKLEINTKFCIVSADL